MTKELEDLMDRAREVETRARAAATDDAEQRARVATELRLVIKELADISRRAEEAAASALEEVGNAELETGGLRAEAVELRRAVAQALSVGQREREVAAGLSDSHRRCEELAREVVAGLEAVRAGAVAAAGAAEAAGVQAAHAMEVKEQEAGRLDAAMEMAALEARGLERVVAELRARVAGKELASESAVVELVRDRYFMSLPVVLADSNLIHAGAGVE